MLTVALHTLQCELAYTLIKKFGGKVPYRVVVHLLPQPTVCRGQQILT